MTVAAMGAAHKPKSIVPTPVAMRLTYLKNLCAAVRTAGATL